MCPTEDLEWWESVQQGEIFRMTVSTTRRDLTIKSRQQNLSAVEMYQILRFGKGRKLKLGLSRVRAATWNHCTYVITHNTSRPILAITYR